MVDFQEFIKIMNDSFVVSDEAIIKEIQELFYRYDPVLLAASFAGLTTCRELQSNAYRLEALIHFSLQYAKGNKKPKKQVVEKAFKLLSKSSLSHQEDPAEDVFVSLVNFKGENFLIFEGIWEGNAFHLQRFLDVIEDMPEENWFIELKKCVWALLVFSDVIAKRRGLTRYSLGNQEGLNEIPTTLFENFNSLKNIVKFSKDDLAELDIEIKDVLYLLFNIRETKNLSKQSLGETDLEKQPLVYDGHHIYILLPSAIGIAIRRLVIDKVTSIDQLNVLEKSIANSYARLFNDLHLLGDLPNCSLNFFRNEKMHLLTADTLIDIDNGRPLHLIFLVDDFSNRENGWINSRNLYTKEIGVALSEKILHTKQFVKNIPNYKEGITLIIGCGWGRNFGFDFPIGEEEDWKIEVISAYDLSIFSLSPGMEAVTFYRLLEAIEKIESENIELMNMNGLLNLYGWAQELNYHLVPHEQMQDAPYDSKVIVPINQNSLLKIRHEAYQAWDEHIKVNPNGEAVHVMKKAGTAYFEEDTLKPLYFSKDDVYKHQLKAVYEGTQFDLWCSLYTSSNSNNSLTFRIFDAACNWLHRTVQVMEMILSPLPEKRIIWNLYFDELILANDYPEPISYKELQNLIVIDCSQKNIDVRFEKRFIDGFAGRENLAEKCMVWSLIKGTCVISENNFSDEQIEVIVDQIVIDSDTKSLHLFSVKTYFDYIQDTLPDAIVINRFDDATMRIGMGWLVQEPKDGNQIIGIKNCTNFLNELIDRIWEKTKVLLVTLNREQLIEKLLFNLEAIRKENRTWNNTIKAVLAQHDDKSNAMEVASRKLAELNGASLSSRLVIEMALCECPIDGQKIAGEIEISKLMAYASMLHHIGGWSDSIKKECMDAEIIISTFGEILFDHSFDDAVISKYGLAVNNKMLNSHANKYNELFISSDTVSSVEEAFDKQFLEAWNDEYGFTIDECLDFLDHLEDIAVKQNLAVIKLTAVDLFPSTASKRSIQSIVDSLVLYPRVSWDNTPDGFEAKDWYPWKFRRRLSLVSRPIVKLDDSNKSTYFIAPASIRESFLYLVRGAYEAEFDDKFYSSDKMRKWNGDKRNFYGHDFNKQVANKLSEFGWQTEPDVFITQILNKSFEKDFGDVDVLAWDEVSGTVLAIECKDLLFAKTYGEIANQLSEFRGVGKGDRLKKHLDRVELLNKNLSTVQKYLGLEKIQTIEIVLVFSNVVPIAYMKNEVLQTINIKLFSELDKI